MGKLTEATLSLYDSGIRFLCEDCEIDEFIPVSNGNKFMEILNDIYYVLDPNATYELTEEGKKYLEQIKNEKKN